MIRRVPTTIRRRCGRLGGRCSKCGFRGCCWDSAIQAL
ncbi:hypothetical protein GON05_00350 [Paenibacillus sp. MAH-34]|uniref:P-type domain-containing protein n=1 Tax=Paenibacillus anseongense TaxID=2682845 RepID=A0ABW9U5L8_9BACL|nr:hypothetical protein [Paenibacillus anseongense]